MRAPSAEFCSRAAWVVWLTYSLAITAGLVLLGPWMQPVRRGTANDFWETACGIELDSTPRNEWGGAAYCVDENWVAYDWPHMHGSDIYYVPMAEARPRFEAATRALAARQVSGADSRFVKGYEQWRAKPADRQTMESLLDCQRDALHEAANARGIHALSYLVSVEQLFWQRWRRARWYWANFIFEWFFLTGLGLFALWPVIRNSNLYRWAAHVSLLPLLFLLPTYLGYATTSFTSGARAAAYSIRSWCASFTAEGRTSSMAGCSAVCRKYWSPCPLPKGPG